MESRTIRVRGTAKASAVPDWVVISFDVNSYNYDYAKCMEQLANQTDSLRQELTAVGLEKDNLKTYRFEADTHYEHYDRRRVFKGYRASHDIRVEFPFDREFLNKVLNTLGKTASKATFNISFIVKDSEPLRQEAIAEAVKNCKEKAQVLSEAAGVTLGEILQIDYSWSEVRFESSMEICAMESPMADSSYDITPEDFDLSESVTTIWAIE